MSATPFPTGTGVAARSTDEVRALYQTVLREAGDMRSGSRSRPPATGSASATCPRA